VGGHATIWLEFESTQGRNGELIRQYLKASQTGKREKAARIMASGQSERLTGKGSRSTTLIEFVFYLPPVTPGGAGRGGASCGKMHRANFYPSQPSPGSPGGREKITSSTFTKLRAPGPTHAPTRDENNPNANRPMATNLQTAWKNRVAPSLGWAAVAVHTISARSAHTVDGDVVMIMPWWMPLLGSHGMGGYFSGELFPNTDPQWKGRAESRFS